MRELNPNNTIALGNVTVKAEGRSLILYQGGRTLCLQEEQLKAIDDNDAEIYLNAEMAEEDKKYGETIFSHNFRHSQVVPIRRFIVNKHGESLTIGKKLLHCNLHK